MARRAQLVCACSGVAFVVLFLIGFWAFAGFVPPPSPGDSAERIAARYTNNRNGIRTGLIICMFASGLLAPWFASIAVQMRRIEGSRPILTYVQLLAGAATVIEFLVPPMFWQAAAFRADRSPETVQALNDIGWLPFLGIISTAMIQGYAFGAVILADRRAVPVFPRWLGYYQFWIVSLLLPGATIVFFHSGPLAWNGVLAWWVLLVSYFLWIVVTSVYLYKVAAVDDEVCDDELGVYPTPGDRISAQGRTSTNLVS